MRMEISHDQITWESRAQEFVGDKINKKCQPRKCFPEKTKFSRAQTLFYFSMIMVNTSFCFTSEAVVWWCSVKKVHLEISQNSQENTYGRVSFLEACNFILLKKRLWHRCFPVNFAECLSTPLVAASVTYRNT